MLRLCVLVTTATEQLMTFRIRACGTMAVCLLCVLLCSAVVTLHECAYGVC